MTDKPSYMIDKTKPHVVNVDPVPKAAANVDAHPKPVPAKSLKYRYIGKDGMADDICILGKRMHYGYVVDLGLGRWPLLPDRYPFDKDPRFEACEK